MSTYCETEPTLSTPCNRAETQPTETTTLESQQKERHALAGLDNPFWKSEDATTA